MFVDTVYTEHIDIVSFLNIHEYDRPKFYTLSNIKKTLDALDQKLFASFVKIMIFDALVGEQDRHEENWGIKKINNRYRLSPLYDNGCSLLRNFKDESYASLYYSGKKDFDAYIRRSQTLIYKEDNKKQYKHFELIRFLYDNYFEIVQKELFEKEKRYSFIDSLIGVIHNEKGNVAYLEATSSSEKI